MTEEKDEEYSAMKINGRKISDLRYADDTALLSTTPTGLNKLVQSVKKYSEDKELLFNAKKTEIMSTDKSSTAQDEIEGEQLKNVTNFISLEHKYNPMENQHQISGEDLQLQATN